MLCASTNDIHLLIDDLSFMKRSTLFHWGIAYHTGLLKVYFKDSGWFLKVSLSPKDYDWAITPRLLDNKSSFKPFMEIIRKSSPRRITRRVSLYGFSSHISSRVSAKHIEIVTICEYIAGNSWKLKVWYGFPFSWWKSFTRGKKPILVSAVLPASNHKLVSIEWDGTMCVSWIDHVGK